MHNPLGADRGLGAFVHGLGVGDVDGDGKQDVLSGTTAGSASRARSRAI
ncbi:MAG: FG-GAP repeat protein [Planctomycetes bacterium]|nr:FG-GAP repeat protein [Planctomycetota bacterium]